VAPADTNVAGRMRRLVTRRCCSGAVVWRVLVSVRRASACSTSSISAAHGGLRSRRASRHFSAKASASLRRHSKQGRCPAANAVGSSRKYSSVLSLVPNCHCARFARPLAPLDCGPCVLETPSSCSWGVAVMTTTLVFSLIAALLMAGVIADSLWGRRFWR
jgi:hypothetical protein